MKWNENTATIEFWRGSKLYEKYHYTNNTTAERIHIHTGTLCWWTFQWCKRIYVKLARALTHTCTQHTLDTKAKLWTAQHGTHILAACTFSAERVCVFVYCTILGEGIISWSVSVFAVLFSSFTFSPFSSYVSIYVAVSLPSEHVVVHDLFRSNSTCRANRRTATGMNISYHAWNSEVGFSCCCRFCCFFISLLLAYFIIVICALKTAGTRHTHTIRSLSISAYTHTHYTLLGIVWISISKKKESLETAGSTVAQ